MESDGVGWYRFKGMKSLESLGVPLKNTTVSVPAEFSFESRFFFSLDFFRSRRIVAKAFFSFREMM